MGTDRMGRGRYSLLEVVVVEVVVGWCDPSLVAWLPANGWRWRNPYAGT